MRILKILLLLVSISYAAPAFSIVTVDYHPDQPLRKQLVRETSWRNAYYEYDVIPVFREYTVYRPFKMPSGRIRKLLSVKTIITGIDNRTDFWVVGEDFKLSDLWNYDPANYEKEMSEDEVKKFLDELHHQA